MPTCNQLKSLVRDWSTRLHGGFGGVAAGRAYADAARELESLVNRFPDGDPAPLPEPGPIIAGNPVTAEDVRAMVRDLEHFAEECRGAAMQVGEASHGGNGREVRRKLTSQAARLYRAAALLDYAQTYFFGATRLVVSDADLVRDEEEI